MLPTNEKANLLLTGRNDLYYSSKLSDFSLKEDIDTFQHLYFLSDEEIKKGDWFLPISGIGWLLNIPIQADGEGGYNNEHCKKIISTTDKSLLIDYKGYEYGTGNYYEALVYLPKPSTSFIEKYVEEYNKGNVITEVLVEYETITKRYGSCSIGEGVTMNVEQLKVSKDNTITIRKVKDSWNRDEVIELLKSRESHIDCHTYSKQFIDKQEYRELDKWIQENL